MKPNVALPSMFVALSGFGVNLANSILLKKNKNGNSDYSYKVTKHNPENLEN